MNFNNWFIQSLQKSAYWAKRCAGLLFGAGVVFFVVLLINYWLGWYVPLEVENFTLSLLEVWPALIPLVVSMGLLMRGGKIALLGMIPLAVGLVYLLLLARFFYIGGFNEGDDFKYWLFGGQAAISDLIVPVIAVIAVSAVLGFAKWAESYGRPK